MRGFLNVIKPKSFLRTPDLGCGGRCRRRTALGQAYARPVRIGFRGFGEAWNAFSEESTCPYGGQDETDEGEKHAVVVLDLREWIKGGRQLSDEEPGEAKGYGAKPLESTQSRGLRRPAGWRNATPSIARESKAVRGVRSLSTLRWERQDEIERVAEPDVGLREAIVPGRDDGRQERCEGSSRIAAKAAAR